MSNFFLYDIDGTITKEEIDLWYLFSSSYNLNKEKFNKDLLEYKLNKQQEPFSASKIMMQKTVKILPNNIHDYMNAFVNKIKLDEFVRMDAIQSLKDNSKKGKIIFSTTNYEDLANLFIDKIIKEYKINNIELVSGTSIDWGLKKILHFNCGPLKLKCLEGIDFIEESYGDDPFYNDSYLLNIAKRGYIITTDKNKKFKTNYRLNWK